MGVPPLAGLSPLTRQLVEAVGRPATDPAVTALVADALGQKVPAAATDVNKSKYVVAKKLGLELLFSHDIKNDKYPLIPKGKTQFVPYLALAWVRDKFPDPLPFGVPRNQPTRLVLDPARDVVLSVDARDVTVMVQEAAELSGRHGVPPAPVVGLFVGWAARRGLLDQQRLPAHAALLAAVSLKEKPGSALAAAAFPRGLWDDHLRDEPGLRRFAYRYFHRIGDEYLIDDLIGVFGSREGRHGHAEPALDADDPAALDRATAVLDRRFAPWLR